MFSYFWVPLFLEEGHTYSPSVKARIIENVENTGENQHIFKMYSNQSNHCYEGRRVHSGIPVGEFLKSQLETYTHQNFYQNFSKVSWRIIDSAKINQQVCWFCWWFFAVSCEDFLQYWSSRMAGMRAKFKMSGGKSGNEWGKMCGKTRSRKNQGKSGENEENLGNWGKSGKIRKMSGGKSAGKCEWRKIRGNERGETQKYTLHI